MADPRLLLELMKRMRSTRAAKRQSTPEQVRASERLVNPNSLPDEIVKKPPAEGEFEGLGAGLRDESEAMRKAKFSDADRSLTPELAQTSNTITELQDLLRRYDAGLATGNPDDAAMRLSIAKGSRKGQLEDALRRGETTKPDLTPGSLEEALYEAMMQKDFRPQGRIAPFEEVAPNVSKAPEPPNLGQQRGLESELDQWGHDQTTKRVEARRAAKKDK